MVPIFNYVTESPAEIAIVFGAVFVTMHFLYRRYVSDSGRKLPPAMPSLPIIGSFPFVGSVKHAAAFGISQRNKLGKIYSMRIGSK